MSECPECGDERYSCLVVGMGEIHIPYDVEKVCLSDDGKVHFHKEDGFDWVGHVNCTTHPLSEDKKSGGRYYGHETEYRCPNGCLLRLIKVRENKFGCNECNEWFSPHEIGIVDDN